VSGSGISWAICKSAPRSRVQTDNHASTQSFGFLQAGCPFCRPTNSVEALKESISQIPFNRFDRGARACGVSVRQGRSVLGLYFHHCSVGRATASRVGYTPGFATSWRCRPRGCTVASGVVGVGVVVVVVGVCNRSLMRTSKCTCSIFGVSIGLDPG